MYLCMLLELNLVAVTLFFLNISRILLPNAGVCTFSNYSLFLSVGRKVLTCTSRMFPEISSPKGGWLISPGAGVKGCGEITISLLSLFVIMRLCLGTMID